jgi:hypothetical protein
MVAPLLFYTKEEPRYMVCFLWAEGLQGAEIHTFYVLSMETTLFVRELCK